MGNRGGLSRRQFLGRTAVVGGAVVWAVPTVELLTAGRAFAAGGSSNTGDPGNPGNPGTPGTPGNPTNPGNPSDPGNPNSPDLPTTVEGETITKPVTSIAGGKLSGDLPFTGANAPTGKVLEVAGGLVAAGAVLNHLSRRGEDGDGETEPTG
jgi:hypothetical protein